MEARRRWKVEVGCGGKVGCSKVWREFDVTSMRVIDRCVLWLVGHRRKVKNEVHIYRQEWIDRLVGSATAEAGLSQRLTMQQLRRGRHQVHGLCREDAVGPSNI